LIDADVLIYQYSIAVEVCTEWAPDRFTLTSEGGEAKERLDLEVCELKDELEATDVVMCVSDQENFRKGILSTYKSHRKKKRKPLCYAEVREYVLDVYRSRVMPKLEADDVLGILQTSPRIKGEKIIVSIDKDLDTIPGLHYNPWKDDAEVYDVTVEQADYNHLKQTLAGDTTDGYGGCPKIGNTRAARMLDEDGATWATVLAAYDKAGLGEQEALVQARCARILRKSDWNSRKKEVILWTP